MKNDVYKQYPVGSYYIIGSGVGRLIVFSKGVALSPKKKIKQLKGLSLFGTICLADKAIF